MEPQNRRIESPSWQKPAPGNEQNDRARKSANGSLKNGGNAQYAEDDLDVDKKNQRNVKFNEDDLKEEERKQ